MSLLMQVSDPHFGTERPSVVEALLRLVRRQAPELVVASGDITQRATRRQFEAARDFFAEMGGVPVLAIPGNHDIPLFNLAARVFAPYAQYQRVFGHDLEPVFASARWLVVCVNTTRAYRHKDGEVSAAQVERVAERLRTAAPEQVRVVVVHQPVAVAQAKDRPNLLHGRALAVRRWAAAGADLVMGGHIHAPYVLPLHEVPGGLARRLWAVQAGTAVSARLRGEADNSVNLVRHMDRGRPRRCVVERWDYVAPEREFRLFGARVLVCSSGQG
jgi:3',5'-cyclic AMP phosphodiesterase CpdA